MRCWISETWKIYTFIVPILGVVTVNSLMGVRVVIVMFRAASSNLDKTEQACKIRKVSHGYT